MEVGPSDVMGGAPGDFTDDVIRHDTLSINHSHGQHVIQMKNWSNK